MSPPSPRLGRLAGLAAAFALVAVACTVPDLDRERARAQPLPQTSFIYASDGTLITSLHAEQDRILIPAARIPQHMKDAVVAIEDQRFWSHRGVDLKAILRAAYANANEGEIVQGGSTITQQYVKNAIIGNERTTERKLKEAMLAYQLEQELPKEEILASYLNTVYFGQGAYGLRTAARAFFRKQVVELSLPESALLAGVIASPGRYDPVDRPDAALERRNAVLARMHELGMIDEETYRSARAAGLGLRLAPNTRRYAAPYFVEYVKQQLLKERRFGSTYTQRYNSLFGGGLRIHTTIDLELQKAAEESVSGVLSRPGDPHGALTAIDPETGHIKAMVGGRDFFARPKVDPIAKVNLATGGITGRQAGSSFKPFALVAALENGIAPAQTFAGGGTMAFSDPVCRTSTTQPWVVQNYEGSAFGNVSLEQATVDSVNVVYAQLIRDLGPREVRETAKRMGIRSKLRPLCSSVLGANEVNTLEMASAYGTLATLGTHVKPIAIERIEDAAGTVIFEANPRRKDAVSPAVAWSATEMLRGVVDRGTGVAAQIDRPAAGKTGTAQQWRDAWFVGYVPQLVAAVWVGFPQGQISMVPPRTRIRVTGGSFPAQIWRAFMVKATEDLPIRDFGKPEADFVQVAIDVTQGCVANEFTPHNNIRTVEFVAGTQPRNPCPLVAEPAPGTVPSVIGMSKEAAVRLLQESEFVVVEQTEYEPGFAAGTVTAQEPEAGAEVTSGTEVTIVVSTDDPPLEPIPDVDGLAQGKASKQLEAAGFEVKVAEAKKHDPKIKEGAVIAQTPGAGRKRPIGSTVTITVNPAPKA